MGRLLRLRMQRAPLCIITQFICSRLRAFLVYRRFAVSLSRVVVLVVTIILNGVIVAVAIWRGKRRIKMKRRRPSTHTSRVINCNELSCIALCTGFKQMDACMEEVVSRVAQMVYYNESVVTWMAEAVQCSAAGIVQSLRSSYCRDWAERDCKGRSGTCGGIH